VLLVFVLLVVGGACFVHAGADRLPAAEGTHEVVASVDRMTDATVAQSARPLRAPAHVRPWLIGGITVAAVALAMRVRRWETVSAAVLSGTRPGAPRRDDPSRAPPQLTA
jgi:hypothetical protein